MGHRRPCDSGGVDDCGVRRDACLRCEIGAGCGTPCRRRATRGPRRSQVDAVRRGRDTRCRCDPAIGHRSIDPARDYCRGNGRHDRCGDRRPSIQTGRATERSRLLRNRRPPIQTGRATVRRLLRKVGNVFSAVQEGLFGGDRTNDASNR